jgi:hypothetical protein
LSTVADSTGGPAGVKAPLSGAIPGFGCSWSALSTLVKAIATPPTATRATAAAIPNTDIGKRRQAFSSSRTTNSGSAGGSRSSAAS